MPADTTVPLPRRICEYDTYDTEMELHQIGDMSCRQDYQLVLC